MKRKPKPRRGDVFKVDLGDGTFGFGQILKSPLVAFFNIKTDEALSVDRIVESEVAFSIIVMDYAFTSGTWPIISNADVSPSINETPPFFKKDLISKRIFITYTGAEELPATADEVAGMECAAAWDPEHVVDRLNDFFAGRPNKWLESMKPQ